MRILIITISAIVLFSGSVSAQCINIYNCWLNTYGGTATNKDIFHDIEVSRISGNVFATGETYNAGGSNNDYITVKYSPLGDTLWSRIFNGSGNANDIAHSIAVDDSDNVYVTGESKSASPNGDDYVTIKYNSEGTVKWIRTYNGPSGNADYAYSVCVDSLHNVYVTGSAHMGGGGGRDFVTIKYSSGGVVKWTKNTDFGSADYASKVIVDKFRNVYVTGYSTGGGTGHDYQTVKYDSSGNYLWSADYNYPSNNGEEPSDIAVDNSGNVYVTGTGTGFFGSQSETVKYNSSGTLIWSARYFGAGAAGNSGTALLVDSAGGVYITGSVNGFSSVSDFVTIKYNPANGSELWIARYNGTGDGTDKAASIVQGKNGKIFVGGSSFGSGTGDDFVIVEYDMNTGDTCFVSRFTDAGSELLNAMSINSDKGYIYACGQTSDGTGFYDALTSRYCLLGVVNSVYNIKAAIEGYYDPSSNLMRMKDTVRVYLRNNVTPFAIVDSAKTVLDSSSFSMRCIFNNSASGSYYIVLKHRNTIETWSRPGGDPFVCGTEMNYDFTNAVSKAYGSNMKQVDASPVKFAIYSGDVNKNGIIDLSDILIIYNDGTSFVSGYKVTDVTGDYLTDLSDLLITYNNSAAFVSKIIP